MPQIKKITDLTAPELDLFSRYSESQLFHINEPKPGIFIAGKADIYLSMADFRMCHQRLCHLHDYGYTALIICA